MDNYMDKNQSLACMLEPIAGAVLRKTQKIKWFSLVCRAADCRPIDRVVAQVAYTIGNALPRAHLTPGHYSSGALRSSFTMW
jgi:hypothetical protein